MLIWLTLFVYSTFASSAEVSLAEFLRASWDQSSASRAEAHQAEASNQLVSAARGKYLPHVSVDAIDSTGFPASNSRVDVSGIMASPFRSGFSAGLVVEQVLYDFGRIEAALKGARAEKSLREARIAQDKFRFLTSAGQVYLNCATAKSMRELSADLMTWAHIIQKEAEHFTRTGQRSIVDNSLVQTEVDSLKIELDQLELLQKSLLEQMKLYGRDLGCQLLPSAKPPALAAQLQVEEPSLLLARAEVEGAHAAASGARADRLPKLKAMGSVGYMEKVRLVERKDYAAGIGLSFPIWNGGEDARREEAFRAQAQTEVENLATATLEYSLRLKNLKDETARELSALEAVEQNFVSVQKTMRLAVKRYQALQGPLIDVREAFKQLREIGVQQIQIERSLATASLQLGLLKTRN